MAEGLKSIVSDLVFNAAIESLTPAEYDGATFMRLPPTDPRFRILTLLRWEVSNVLATVESIGNGLSPLRTFFSTAKARDTFGRLVQYILRLVTSILSVMPPSGARRSAARTISAVALSFSDARRTVRTLEFAPFVNAFTTVSSKEPLLIIAARWAIACFHSLDRLRWLQQHSLGLGLLGGSTRTTAKLSFRLLFVAHSCRALQELRNAAATSEFLRLRQLREWSGRDGSTRTGSNGHAPCDDRVAMIANLREAAKQLLCMLQAAHIGKVPLLQTSDVAVGLMGVATSWDDVSTMWRRTFRH